MIPGLLTRLLVNYLPFVNNMRKIYDFTDMDRVYEQPASMENYVQRSFIRQVKKWTDARIGVFCRRFMLSLSKCLTEVRF